MPGKVRFFLFSVSALLFLSLPVQAAKIGIKTSYKQYRIFEHDKGKILCDPYTVKKDDWLYKIFRRKGVISNTNFPLFISVFSEINPEIKNIDLIEPDEHILIPLKFVKQDDYKEKTQGVVEVPVIEYENMPDAFKPYVEKREVKSGDTVSKLIDRSFLDEDGRITEQGIRAFKMANPGIKNIDLIFKGDSIYLPKSEIHSENWFKSFFREPGKKAPETASTSTMVRKKIPNPAIDKAQEAQLRRYAALIGGTLMADGSFYFPGNREGASKLDLASTPVIKLKSGKRMLLIPEGAYDKDIVNTVRQYWKNIEMRKLSRALEIARKDSENDTEDQERPEKTLKGFVKTVLSNAGFSYQENYRVSFFYGPIELSAVVGRIKRANASDLLVDFGNIYGEAFDAIRNQGYDIVTLAPESQIIGAAGKLFKALGASTTQNPSFVKGRHIITLPGLYVTAPQKEIFLAEKRLTDEMTDFLEEKDIQIIHTAATRPRLYNGKGYM